MTLTAYSADLRSEEGSHELRHPLNLSPKLFDRLAASSGDCELFVFSSNDKLEIFISAEHQDVCLTRILSRLQDETGLPAAGLKGKLTRHEGGEAVRQFWYSAIGMLSPGQFSHDLQNFRNLFTAAREAGCVGSVLRRLYQRGIWLSEKVRMELKQELSAVTLESVVSDLAQKIFGDLHEHKALFWTASPLCESFVRDLRLRKMKAFFFAGKSTKLSSVCENYGGRMVADDQLVDILPEIDLLLLFDHSSVQALHNLQLPKVMQRRRNAPLLLVSLFETNGTADLLKPFGKLYNVFSYSRDDLEGIVSTNLKEHQKITVIVDQLIEKEVDEFFRWHHSREEYRFGNIVGKSEQMHHILELIARISQTDISVLIDGESGTGKELIAKAIHEHSSRVKNKFVVVNCGALPESLLESELFGHVRGAFTGATSSKKGLLEEANDGTIFLDEVGEMSQATQVKLLRFLQEGEAKPVGSNETLKLNTRVIAATNRDLAAMVQGGEFRQDLYYRLNVIQITLPSLRARKDDIIPLVTFFVAKYAGQFHKNVYGVDEQCQTRLLDYLWPGNIRELENAIERAVALCSGDLITVSDLPPNITQGEQTFAANHYAGDMSLKELERKHIAAMLRQHDWNYDLVTQLLGIGRTTLWRKMKEYGLSN